MNLTDPSPILTLPFEENPEIVSVKKKNLPTPVDHKDALKASVEYFNGDELAATVWINKYALKDSQGNLYELTPADMAFVNGGV